MDLKQVTESILESLKGIVEEDFAVECDFTDTVNEINLRSKSDDKHFHILVLETTKDIDTQGVKASGF